MSNGNTLLITDDADELESADYVVCVPASTPAHFPDDIYSFCCVCDVKVRHRPHVPVAVKRICMDCAVSGMKAEAEAGKLEIVASFTTMDEFRKYLEGKS